MRGRRRLGIVGVFMGLVILMEGGCANAGTRVSQQEDVGAGTWGRQSVATEASPRGRFTDLREGAYYWEAVDYYAQAGLVSGTSPTTFSPEGLTSRGQLVTILWRQAGEPEGEEASFSDVLPTAYYSPAVGWASGEGIVAGYGDGRFGPEEPITRAQLATILWREAGKPSPAGESSFTDRAAIPAYAAQAAAWAQEQGIITGKEGRFDPQANATRGETVTMLYRQLIGIGGAVEEQEIRIVTESGAVIPFRLNGSPAALDLYRQLPLTLPVEDYAGNEKIFTPPASLDTRDTPLAQGPAGTLAYYAPWGNVAIYYGDCGGAAGLYELGEASASIEGIAGLSGEIRIEAVSAPAPSPAPTPAPTPELTPQPTPPQEEAMNQITITVNGQEFSTVLEDNAAVKALLEKLEEGPLELSMGEYGGFEKVGGLGFSLPASDTQITTQPGDMVLYQSNQLVVFTGSNTWSYTKLGRVEDPTALIDALGPGDVRLLLSASRA